MASVLDSILLAIENLTGIRPDAKGGDTFSTITYAWTRQGGYNFRLELDISGGNVASINSMSNEIINEIVDFGDIGKFKGASITQNGGGIIGEGNRLTQVIYFDVVDYYCRINNQPEGTIELFANGTWEVSKYRYAKVNVAGAPPEYEGPTEFDPRRVTQVAETEGFLLNDNIKINPIRELEQPYLGGTQLVIGFD